MRNILRLFCGTYKSFRRKLSVLCKQIESGTTLIPDSALVDVFRALVDVVRVFGNFYVKNTKISSFNSCLTLCL